MMTVYLVWNEKQTQCVGFTNEKDAKQAAGISRLGNPCSTLALAWREAYAEDQPKLKFKMQPVEI